MGYWGSGLTEYEVKFYPLCYYSSPPIRIFLEENIEILNLTFVLNYNRSIYELKIHIVYYFDFVTDLS